MKLDGPFKEPADIDHSCSSMDRRIIRVDIPPAYAGVTAALRRAFEPVAMDSCDAELAALLRKLN